MFRALWHRFEKPAKQLDVLNMSAVERLRGGGSEGFASVKLEVDPTAYPPWDRPSNRDWLTIEVDGEYLFVGRIEQSGFDIGADEDGHVMAENVMVNAVGFLDVVLDITTTPARSTSIGGLYAQRDWYEQVIETMSKQTNGPVGANLRVFLEAAFNCRVPGTVFGFGSGETRSLGECVYPLFDKQSAMTIAYSGPVEPVQGFSMAGVQSITKAAGKATQLLAGTFQPNDQLIELTATLIPYDPEKALATLPVPTVGGGHRGRRGQVLGLRYRIAPFRVAPLRDRIIGQGGIGESANLPDGAATLSRFDAAAFNRATWKELPVRTVSETVTRIHGTRSGADECSATTAWLSFITGGEDAHLSEVLGLPYFDADRTARDGLRLQTTLWPFVSPVGGGGAALDGPVGADVDGLTSRLAATLYQFATPGALFEEGEVVLGVFSAGYKPGMIVRVPVGGRVLTAYIVSVTHSVETDGEGHVTGTTTLGYARGLFDEALRDVSVPVASYAGRGVSVDPDTVVADPKAECIEGRPVGPGGFAPFTEIPKVEWLKGFALAAIMPSGGSALRDKIEKTFAGVAAGTDAVDHRNVWASAACLYVVQRYWRQIYPDARVRISGKDGWIRFGADVTHSASAAFDFYVEINDGSGARIPAHRAWGALWKLEAAGRIPKGGKGLYLNVNPTTGVTVDQAGTIVPRSASYTGAGPGGSGGTHYDFAGSFGTADTPRASRRSGGQSWLAVDWDGDGRDEIRLGDEIVVNNNFAGTGRMTVGVSAYRWQLNDVLAGIADPVGLLTKPTQGRGAFTETVPALKQLFRPGGKRAGFDEASRVKTRDAIRDYFTSIGRNDPRLINVSNKVPNAMQVLGLEPWCDSQNDGGTP